MDLNKRSLEKHKKYMGNLSMVLKDNLDSQLKLSTYYTPGVAEVSTYVAKHINSIKEYTWVGNNLAVISNGSAVLGLGDIGAEGAMPVMEGKAMLFKTFADINAVPIVLEAKTADEIVTAIEAIAPSFGAINLEDIAAPICFEVEDRLKKSLKIPIMHDDQHGTAVVVLAGIINSLKVTNRTLPKSKVVIIGGGAAGVATAKLLHLYGKPQITAVDSKGIIDKQRDDLNETKKYLASLHDNSYTDLTLESALLDADIVIGVSRPNLITPAMVKTMAKDPVIFAMSNPNPEILPGVALSAGAGVVATGRSDYPNQVNNVLAFPGIFRGALDNNVSKITDAHKIAAAEVIASLVKNPTKDKIIPTVFDKQLVSAIANVIR